MNETVEGWMRIMSLLSKDVPPERAADRDIAMRFCKSSLMMGEEPPTKADFSSGGYSFGRENVRVLVRNGCVAVSYYLPSGDLAERNEIPIEDYEAAAQAHQNKIRETINLLSMDPDDL